MKYLNKIPMMIAAITMVTIVPNFSGIFEVATIPSVVALKACPPDPETKAAVSVAFAAL